MIFELNGGKSVYFEESFISQAFLVLRNRKTVPNVPVMNNIVVSVKRDMREDTFPKVSGARQKVLCEVLCNARDPCPFN